MPTTPRGLYYPPETGQIPDVPADMKKLAESAEDAFALISWQNDGSKISSVGTSFETCTTIEINPPVAVLVEIEATWLVFTTGVAVGTIRVDGADSPRLARFGEATEGGQELRGTMTQSYLLELAAGKHKIEQRIKLEKPGGTGSLSLRGEDGNPNLRGRYYPA